MKKFSIWAVCCSLLQLSVMAQPSTIENPNQDYMITSELKPGPADLLTPDADPINVQMHTLKNGMKLFMSINKNEPRVFTNIAVRAGSKYDPAETTGLAHYLEHMLFKGSDKIGALDWPKEKKLLDKISGLYEDYRKESDPDKRKRIYAQIDETSGEAAKLVAANEYDKLVGSLGAKATNAYTWVEQTVYVNDIPSNEIERWMQLESERFRMLVLRLFHTELEAVYEEFNINQDRDFRKVFKATSEALFPTHPYGTQTTIGTSEHLKNPSMVNIHQFFNTYYVPNNMAIVLSGDFDPAQVIAWAEKYFGTYGAKEVARPKFAPQPAISSVIKKEVWGQEAPSVQLGWRFEGAASEDPTMINLVGAMLYNRQAGLIDLDLIQRQKVLDASSWAWLYEDYSAAGLSGKPREGQTLEEVEQLLLGEIEKLREGSFPDWLIDACVKDARLSQLKGYESNNGRVGAMTDAFILGVNWDRYNGMIDRMSKITKQQVVEFVNKYMKDNNYVVVYKRTGEDKSVVKVEKPAITPIAVNREAQSEYGKQFMSLPTPRLAPVFVDFDTQMRSYPLRGGIHFDYIANTENETFSLNYIFEMGKLSDKKLALAITYLPYLGTDKFTAEELQQEFYKLGISFDVTTNDDRVYVSLNGLNESLERGLVLFEHMLSNVKGDPEALKNLVADILSKRENDKKNKNTILRQAMASYARYGSLSPFTDILSKAELEAITPDELVKWIKELNTYQHSIFYYGPSPVKEVALTLMANHTPPAELKKVIPARVYREADTNADKVYFVDFPMVQAEILMLSKGTPKFNLNEYIMSDYFNNYFGGGLSSIVFQEIRESRALAYSASCNYTSPAKRDRSHYFTSYVGTQPDKMKDAMIAMREIIEKMPVSEDQMENARQSVLKRIESERITRSNIFWTYKANMERGINYDVRKDVYQKIQNTTVQDLKQFQETYVKGRHYTILVLGSKDRIDMNYLRSLGDVIEMKLQDVFGY